MKKQREHGMISTDIIPAPVRARPKESIFHSELCACPAGNHVGTIWYNIDRYYTCADLRPTEGRTNTLANRVHPSESTISTDIIPAPVRARPKGEYLLLRTVRMPRKEPCRNDMV